MLIIAEDLIDLGLEGEATMLKNIGLIFILFIGGCSIMVPPRIVVENSPYEYELVVEAVDDIRYVWEETYEVSPERYLEDITIGFYEKGDDWDKIGCIRGITYSQSSIGVGYKEQGWGLQTTAIWHELTHVIFWNIWKDPDGDHQNGEGPWTQENNEIISNLKKQWTYKYGE